MDFWNTLLRIFNTQMQKPAPYGWFHLLSLVLTFGSAFFLCFTHKKGDDKRVRRIIFVVALIVFVLEIYKQILFSFSYGKVIEFKYKWYIFPWQLCSTPMYAGLLTGIFKKGKVHDALCAYLATYAVFAGICVMAYPSAAVGRAIGLNIQTMFCHGSMITVGIYLLYTQYVKLEHKTILKALSIFTVAMGIAITLNELVFRSGIIQKGGAFNMFYISPHYKPTLAVYSVVQKHVPYPWCLLIYFSAVTLGSYIILLIAIICKKLFMKGSSKNE